MQEDVVEEAAGAPLDPAFPVAVCGPAQRREGWRS